MYKYVVEEGVDYPLFLFTSDSGLVYNLRLEKLPYDFNNIESIRSISVGCDNNQSPPLDSKVGETVCFILEEYLSDNPNTLLSYVCDNLDHRGAIRQRKFSIWHANFGNDGFTACPQDILTPDYDPVYTCLIFCTDSFDEKELIKNYSDEITHLENEK